MKRIVVVYIITIALILLGVTYALTSSDISLAVSTANIDINYSDGSNGVLDTSNLKLYPILDNNVTNNTSNVIRINFTVGGSSNNVIYDIALNEIVVDNELLSKYVKWRLYKNNELISEGSLSPEFDTISNGRLVLTNIQQDLTTSDSYEFILWLSDSCQEEDITKCIDTENQDYLLNKNITGKIEIEAYTGNKKALVRNPYRETLYNILKANATLDTDIDFNQISSDTNGKGVYIRSGTENDTYPIYYYRGEVYDNNVIFANMCFKIVRTTETGGIKLIYNGLPTNGTCDNTGNSSQIGPHSFNSLSNSLAYVGYMYGAVYTYIAKDMSSMTDVIYYGNDVTYSNGTYTLVDTISSNDWSSIYNEGLNNYHYTCLGGTTCTSVYYIYYTSSSTMYYITLTNGKTVEDALSEMLDNNTTSSTIKGNNTTSGTLDYWYYNNIEQKGYYSYIEDTIWCNDRSIYDLGGWDPDGGSTTSSLLLGAYERVRRTYSPSLSCKRAVDRFTVNEENGNGDLDYPVGLITADEIILAGGKFNIYNSTYYLHTGNSWWIGSPIGLYGSSSYVYYVSYRVSLYNYLVNAGYGVRPAISLKNNVVVTSGNGTVNDPFVLS